MTANDINNSDIDHVARLMLRAWDSGEYARDRMSQDALQVLRENRHEVDERVFRRMMEIREQR